MEHSDDQQLSDASLAPADLLSPSAALARFDPPVGTFMDVSDERQKETRARYGVRVGELALLVNQNAGSEVLTMPSVAVLPGSPPGFLGLVNVRGNLIPLYELRVLLGVESRMDGGSSRVQIFGQNDEAVAIIIDDYPIALNSLRPLPTVPPLPDMLKNHVPAAFVEGDTVWLEFEHNSFFDDITVGGAEPRLEE